jgi:hypothetical protein
MTELKALTPHAVIPAEQARRDRGQKRRLRTFLPELIQLERLLAEAPEGVSSSVLSRVNVRDLELPVYRVDLGTDRKDAPVVMLILAEFMGLSVSARRW